MITSAAVKLISTYRLKTAVRVAHIAERLSKMILNRSGQTISGRFLLWISPEATSVLARKKIAILVSGTNGKTSTTHFLTKIVSQLGDVSTNSSGSNLNWGIANALSYAAPYAVLEVDELHLSNTISAVKPKAVVLLNLSRDQLHRSHEVKRIADRWADAISSVKECTFVIDVDDPYLNFATRNSTSVVRVSFGGRRHLDGAVCPACGKYLNWDGGIYNCSCGLNNKNTDRTFQDGPSSYRNAILANVAGEIIGAPPLDIEFEAPDRVITKEISGSSAIIRLAKNPASWIEALQSVNSNNVVLMVNAREVDGFDTSWLWDISFVSLQRKKVIVCGERGLDLSYRLHIEGVENTLVKSFEEAIEVFPVGSNISALASYTAFFALASN